jgi:hypothetical protein
MATPIERYTPSPRAYQDTIQDFAYGPDDETRRVNDQRISFKGHVIRVPRAFQKKTVALRPTQTSGVYDLIYRTNFISSVDLRTKEEQDQCVTDVPEHPSRMSPV